MMAVLLLMAALASDTGFQPGDDAAVKVMRQFLYPTPAFYAQPLLELALGQVLTVVEVGSAWYRVSTASDQTGWVHSTALAAASSGSGTVGSGSGSATQDEVTLAGRGFNSDVEAQYRSDNPTLDFAKVDAMTNLKISSETLAAFLSTGGLIELAEGSAPPPAETPGSGSGSREGGTSR
jgi:hypothetical protein